MLDDLEIYIWQWNVITQHKWKMEWVVNLKKTWNGIVKLNDLLKKTKLIPDPRVINSLHTLKNSWQLNSKKYMPNSCIHKITCVWLDMTRTTNEKRSELINRLSPLPVSAQTSSKYPSACNDWRQPFCVATPVSSGCLKSALVWPHSSLKLNLLAVCSSWSIHNCFWHLTLSPSVYWHSEYQSSKLFIQFQWQRAGKSVTTLSFL